MKIGCLECGDLASGQPPLGFLCPDCEEDFKLLLSCPVDRQLLMNGVSCFWLFPYEGFLKRICLDIKVRGNLRSLSYLLCCIRLRLAFSGLALPAATCVPMPSSMWSRFRGKPDISYALCQDLVTHKGLLFDCFPLVAYLWRLKKRSMMANRGEIELSRWQNRCLEEFWNERLQGFSTLCNVHFLVVDDIMTTGASLRAMIRPAKKHRLRVEGCAIFKA